MKEIFQVHVSKAKFKILLCWEWRSQTGNYVCKFENYFHFSSDLIYAIALLIVSSICLKEHLSLVIWITDGKEEFSS